MARHNDVISHAGPTRPRKGPVNLLQVRPKPVWQVLVKAAAGLSTDSNST